MIQSFGTLPDGGQVSRIILSNGVLKAEVLTYGAILRSLFVKGCNGETTDVVLGYDRLEEYVTRSGRMGAVIGRFANRIGDSRFVLDGKEYRLSSNRGQDHIHGGFNGFDKCNWDILESSEHSVTLGLDSPDMDEGYPGNLHVEVTYLLEGNSLAVKYSAVSDADTILNLTNHSYFNLGGSGTIEDHEVSVDSTRYTELNDRGIPTGKVFPVGNSFMDLRRPVILGNMFYYGGYDHNYLLDNECKEKPFSRIYCGKTGITMTVATDMPAVQFYTAEGLKEVSGKYGQTYGKRSGLCLETQFCPDSPNHDNFPSCILRKGDCYDHRTVFSFDSA